MKISAIKNISCHGLAFVLVLTHGLFLPMNAVAELPTPHDNFLSFGQGNTHIVGNHMEVNQLSDRAVFQWDSFNIGKQNSVHFNQNSASAIALNRIFQADASVIAGQLSAIGTIYLLNQNGIIFDSGAQIDVGSLVASTLDVDEDLIMNSSLTQAIENEQAAFFYDPATDTGLEGMGNIEVHEGAELNAAPNGRIFLFAPEVENNGSIKTPEGQTILAAAEEKVYLAASTDKDFRGLYVEVDGGGTVSNNGSIEADLGNVTLMGMAVNQNGRIRATTSVDLNGSIRLLARDTVTISNFQDARCA